MTKITAPISSGELLDKLSILQIKLENISDTHKLNAIKTEQKLLTKLMKTYLGNYAQSDARLRELIVLNSRLWKVEDEIRQKESKKEFDKDFITLARNVYTINDERFAVKARVNQETGSLVSEQKSYSPY